MISSPLMSESYERLVDDYEATLAAELVAGGG
jgi:hypothetical protein